MINNISNNLITGNDNDEDYDNIEDEKYKNILNKFKEDDKENDLFYNQINNYNNYNLNNSKDIINEKPKMLRKNSLDKEKGLNQKKMISFEEFLLKENVNE